jgi:putative SOS response-associated peptidase YedK
MIVADGFDELTANSDPKAKRSTSEPWFCIAGLWRTQHEPAARECCLR